MVNKTAAQASRKRYMMCSIRELHRDLYDDKMGLAEAIDDDGNTCINSILLPISSKSGLIVE